MEMEILIRELSETLINELALRDELEYEKELKNTFISLLLAVQNKRRQFHVEKKRGKSQGKQATGMKTTGYSESCFRHQIFPFFIYRSRTQIPYNCHSIPHGQWSTR